MDLAQLTRPEGSAELRNCKRIRQEVTQRGGCGCCLNRDRSTEFHGRALCSVASRSFPLCMSEEFPGVEFAFDPATIKGAK